MAVPQSRASERAEIRKVSFTAGSPVISSIRSILLPVNANMRFTSCDAFRSAFRRLFTVAGALSLSGSIMAITVGRLNLSSFCREYLSHMLYEVAAITVFFKFFWVQAL